MVDGFFVKRVQDVRESAAYLTIMTRYLTKLYQVVHLLADQRFPPHVLYASLIIFFYHYLRTELWFAAPESWKVTEMAGKSRLGPLPAHSFPLPSLTTVPSKTK